jgi:predicted NBD/HSP70 family sugar kinase
MGDMEEASMDDTWRPAAGIAELARRIAGEGKVVAGATQGEVLWQIAQHAGRASRGRIAEESGFSTATVSKAVAILIREKLVDDGAQGERRPGAPLRWTGRYAAAGVVIATRKGHPVEFIGTVTMLDGTSLPAFEHEAMRECVNPDGQLESDPKSLLDQLGEFVRSLLGKAASSNPETWVLGCGVSVGGHVDGDRGVVRKSFNTGWKDDFYLAKDLAEWLKRDGWALDVVVENDVTSYAVQMNLTERPADSYVLVAIFHDGIGGAVVVKGRTWRGAHGLPGEIGHIYVGSQRKEKSSQDHDEEPRRNRKSPLDRGDEPQCRCGQVGCLEAYATPFAILRKAYPERVDELAPGTQSFDDAFYQLASRPQADEEVADIFHEAGTALGRGLADVILWLDPEKIFLYLPPALTEDNPFLAGKSYLDAVTEELRHVFSVGEKVAAGEMTPRVPLPKTQRELEELGAKAAASTVLRKLILEVEEIKKREGEKIKRQ